MRPTWPNIIPSTSLILPMEGDFRIRQRRDRYNIIYRIINNIYNSISYSDIVATVSLLHAEVLEEVRRS